MLLWWHLDTCKHTEERPEEKLKDLRTKSSTELVELPEMLLLKTRLLRSGKSSAKTQRPWIIFHYTRQQQKDQWVKAIAIKTSAHYEKELSYCTFSKLWNGGVGGHLRTYKVFLKSWIMNLWSKSHFIGPEFKTNEFYKENAK